MDGAETLLTPAYSQSIVRSQRPIADQRSGQRTSAIVYILGGAFILVVSCLFGVFSVVFSERLLMFIMIAFSAITLLGGIFFLMAGVTSYADMKSTKTRKVDCPFCSRPYEDHDSIPWVRCESCYGLLEFGTQEDVEPRVASCQYCEKQVGLLLGAEPPVCADCNVAPGFDGGLEPCPQCGSRIPDTALFCNACDYVRVEAYPSNMDWLERVRKSERGNFKLGVAWLHQLSQKLPLLKRDSTSVTDVTDLLVPVLRVAESFEEAAENPVLASDVCAQLRRLDGAWAEILLMLNALARGRVAKDQAQLIHRALVMPAACREYTLNKVGAALGVAPAECGRTWNTKVFLWETVENEGEGTFSGALTDLLRGEGELFTIHDNGVVAEANRLDPEAFPHLRARGWDVKISV